jgi:hypothetical protein
LKVKELIKMLKELNPEYEIDMSTDEEGNSYGDIDNAVAEGNLKDGTPIYSLYPYNCQLPEEKFMEEKFIV